MLGSLLTNRNKSHKIIFSSQRNTKIKVFSGWHQVIVCLKLHKMQSRTA